jgi:hypothetical protein
VGGSCWAARATPSGVAAMRCRRTTAVAEAVPGASRARASPGWGPVPHPDRRAGGRASAGGHGAAALAWSVRQRVARSFTTSPGLSRHLMRLQAPPWWPPAVGRFRRCAALGTQRPAADLVGFCALSPADSAAPGECGGWLTMRHADHDQRGPPCAKGHTSRECDFIVRAVRP